jgi:hypothetical protein
MRHDGSVAEPDSSEESPPIRAHRDPQLAGNTLRGRRRHPHGTPTGCSEAESTATGADLGGDPWFSLPSTLSQRCRNPARDGWGQEGEGGVRSSLYSDAREFRSGGWNGQRDWKGNVPLGHFYNVLVIKCPTHIKWIDYVPNKQEVQIM